MDNYKFDKYLAENVASGMSEQEAAEKAYQQIEEDKADHGDWLYEQRKDRRTL